MDTVAAPANNDRAARRIIEGFAGPGGWSEGLRILNLHHLSTGYEWDREACDTARAAGHARIQADVADVDLWDVAADGPVWGLIMSPPCQSFSNAGKQKGKLDRPRLDAHVQAIRDAGHWIPYDRAGWHDDRSPLVLEPLRWALNLQPEWITLEQVPAVLPLWHAYADILTDHGWHATAGNLQAEQYGVPQTRKRAILVARRSGPVSLPAATHRPYRKGVGRGEGDPALLPWVSMSDALGWGMTSRPYVSVAPGTGSGGTDPLVASGSGARRTVYGERDAERWTDKVGMTRYRGAGMRERHGERPGRDADEPAFTMTTGGGEGGGTGHVPLWQLRQSAQQNATVRTEDEPAPTITSGHDRAERVWEPTALAQAGVTSTAVDPRPIDTPAGTVTGKGTGYWTDARPATTVTGDPRVWPPGHKVNQADRDRLGADVADARYGDRAGTKAVRVSVAEASVLQSFPHDYPWQGTVTAHYRQVGDAVPPMLAAAVVAAVTG